MNTMSIRQLSIIFLPAVLVLLAIVGISRVTQIPIPTMTRDVTAVVDIHPLAGSLSSLGILVWCASASVCLFAAFSLFKTEHVKVSRFLLSAAGLSMYLMFDDLFQIHEWLVPKYLNISEDFVIAALAVAMLSHLIGFRKIILRTNYLLLLLALGMLGFAVVVDVLFQEWLHNSGDWGFLIEDGAKWLGIASWGGYHANTSFYLLHTEPTQKSNEP